MPGDRLAALALATMNAVGILALLAVTRSDWRYLDIALVLAVLFGALPIAVGRLSRGREELRDTPEEKGASHAVAD
ncbi:MAG: monovalent cation/H+ antiporter complex subunit F [Alphaproteobacteria bacterium]